MPQAVLMNSSPGNLSDSCDSCNLKLVLLVILLALVYLVILVRGGKRCLGLC